MLIPKKKKKQRDFFVDVFCIIMWFFFLVMVWGGFLFSPMIHMYIYSPKADLIRCRKGGETTQKWRKRKAVIDLLAFVG